MRLSDLAVDQCLLASGMRLAAIDCLLLPADADGDAVEGSSGSVEPLSEIRGHMAVCGCAALALVEPVLARGGRGVSVIGVSVAGVGQAVSLIGQAVADVGAGVPPVGEALLASELLVSRREPGRVGAGHRAARRNACTRAARNLAFVVGVLGLEGGDAFIERLGIAMELSGAAMQRAPVAVDRIVR